MDSGEGGANVSTLVQALAHLHTIQAQEHNTLTAATQLVLTDFLACVHSTLFQLACLCDREQLVVFSAVRGIVELLERYPQHREEIIQVIVSQDWHVLQNSLHGLLYYLKLGKEVALALDLQEDPLLLLQLCRKLFNQTTVQGICSATTHEHCIVEMLHTINSILSNLEDQQSSSGTGVHCAQEIFCMILELANLVMNPQ